MKTIISILTLYSLAFLSYGQDSIRQISSDSYKSKTTIEKLKVLNSWYDNKQVNREFATIYGSHLLFKYISGLTHIHGVEGILEVDSILTANNCNKIRYNSSTIRYWLCNLAYEEMNKISTPSEKIRMIDRINDLQAIHWLLDLDLKEKCIYEIIQKRLDELPGENPGLDGLKVTSELAFPNNKEWEMYFFYTILKNKRKANPQLNNYDINKMVKDFYNKKLLTSYGTADLQREFLVLYFIEDEDFMESDIASRKTRINTLAEKRMMNMFSKRTLEEIFLK